MTLVVASGGVKRILLAGMSGTGKPILIGELAARGYRAIAMDEPEWSTYHLQRVDGSEPL